MLHLISDRRRRGAQVFAVQFDAHGDTWADDDPARVDHGTFCYKAIREGLLNKEMPPIDFHEIIALIAPRAFLSFRAE